MVAANALTSLLGNEAPSSAAPSPTNEAAQRTAEEGEHASDQQLKKSNAFRATFDVNEPPTKLANRASDTDNPFIGKANAADRESGAEAVFDEALPKTSTLREDGPLSKLLTDTNAKETEAPYTDGKKGKPGATVANAAPEPAHEGVGKPSAVSSREAAQALTADLQKNADPNSSAKSNIADTPTLAPVQADKPVAATSTTTGDGDLLQRTPAAPPASSARTPAQGGPATAVIPQQNTPNTPQGAPQTGSAAPAQALFEDLQQPGTNVPTKPSDEALLPNQRAAEKPLLGPSTVPSLPTPPTGGASEQSKSAGHAPVASGTTETPGLAVHSGPVLEGSGLIAGARAPGLAQPTAGAPLPAAVQQVAEAIRVRTGEQTISIRLDPPELGSVKVELAIENGRTVHAVVSAEQTDTNSLLRRHADILHKELMAAGFDDVTVDMGEFAQDPHAQGAEEALTILRDGATDSATAKGPADGHYNIITDDRIDLRL